MGGGAEGKYILIGVWRMVAPGGFKNLLLIELNEGKLSVHIVNL